ncbi:pyruvate kinase [Silvibacterium dinghuense]|uniref:Pyruvate kinase n=1 Tax=Silvibacterium dinghuense TaxID=1560006 RepID=A0A4Q1SIT8_9BACT|nr:pyruvate kinase [Silvibacterium dinghuense]RXS97538.1 pyruvate kinase [Silvibacterium dinghuense]GGG99849.1 pyruvate kinase [Silvibacterium dinghuense]
MNTSVTGLGLPIEGQPRRAKIVGTLGPASNQESVFRGLVRAGLDVARLNFSHGIHSEKQALIDMVRKIAAEEGRSICILADLQGPKIRTGKLENRTPITLVAGQSLTITPRNILGNTEVISTTFLTLAENLEAGARILLSDGLIELHVVAVKGEDVECTVVNGGVLGENKGINLPGIPVKVPALTEKDAEDLDFAIKAGVDAIAVSFVRTAEDVRLVKERIAGLGSDAWVVAKLEKPQAIDNLDEIMEATDGIMVARGDLGVEVPPEKVPAIQKLIIRKASSWRKPVITATQMLESMIENPRPTRAEASDVANAIYDGTDAVMLSAESAAGKYPVEAVKMMAKIIVETESHLQNAPAHEIRPDNLHLTVSETICESMAHAAQDLDVRAIAVFTETGTTARQLSKYRPVPPIYALSSVETVVNRMNLLWGTTPLLCEKAGTTDQMVAMAERLLEEGGYARSQDIIGIVAGTRTKTGSTNFLRLHVLGDQVNSEEAEKLAAAATR